MGLKLKEKIPWQFKVGLKLLIGFFRIDYKFLKRIKFVEHGKMDDFGFAISIFDRQCKVVEERYPEFHAIASGMFCEMGPGDSILTGVIAAMHGFKGSTLIDVGEFENTSSEAIRQTFKKYGKISEIEDVPDTELINHLKSQYNIQYKSNGLSAYYLLGTETISFSYSNSVVQHIAKNEVKKIFYEMFRAHIFGSISVHSINFLDHFSGGFRNKNIPEIIWESSLIKRANLYTNRLSIMDLLSIFSEVGFKSYVHSYQLLGEQNILMSNLNNTPTDPTIFHGKIIVRATIYLIK